MGLQTNKYLRRLDKTATKETRLMRVRRFTNDQCHKLFADVLIHDDPYPNAKLPKEIHLDYSQQQLSDCFQICLELWKLDVSRDILNKTIKNIAQSGALDQHNKMGFKHIRANFKHLRFAYITFSKKHRVPFLFHSFIAVMGYLQDTLKTNQKRGIFSSAYVLQFCTKKWSYSTIVRKLDQFQPSNTEGFRNFVNSEINFIADRLTCEKVTGHIFHRMRISISRQVALYDNLKNLYPSDYHTSISQFLSTLNGMMGGLHDELIVKKYNKTQDYHDDLFDIPVEIRRKLTELVQSYQN